MKTTLQVFQSRLLLALNAVTYAHDRLVLGLIQAVAWLQAPLSHGLCAAKSVTAACMVAAIRGQVACTRTEICSDGTFDFDNLNNDKGDYLLSLAVTETVA